MNPIIIMLNQHIVETREAIAAFQNECPHPEDRRDKEYGSNANDYDRHPEVSYWTEMHCQECDKRWTVEGSV